MGHLWTRVKWRERLVPAAAVLLAPPAYFKVVAVAKSRSWNSAEESRSGLAGEHLNGAGYLFRRLYLHLIVWSGTRNLYCTEVQVFQACACGESMSMEKQRGLVA